MPASISTPTRPLRASSDLEVQPRTRVSSLVLRRFLEPPPWVVLIQIFIGFGWLRAATEKLIDPQWWNGEAIAEFVADNESQVLGWFEPFLTAVVLPNLVAISLVVLLGQLIAGASLLTNRHLVWGLGIGAFMNLTFVACGAIDPSAFYLVLQGVLFLWLLEEGAVDPNGVTLSIVQVVAGTVAVISIPFIRTIHPAEVIHDAAAMYAFLGSLTVFISQVFRRRVSETATQKRIPDRTRPDLGRVAATPPPSPSRF